MKRRHLFGSLAAVCASPWQALAHQSAPPATQRGTLALVNAHLHPITSANILNGRLLMQGGRIVALGGSELSLPPDAKTLDLGGLQVYPGLIAVNTTLGLAEVASVRATVDHDETGPLNPNARAIVAVNADSELIAVARAGGVVAAQTVPRVSAGGVIAGTSGVIQLDGWHWEDMALLPEQALHINLPSLRRLPNADANPRMVAEQRRSTQQRFKLLEDAFESARDYDRARTADPQQAVDVRWEAMRKVFPRAKLTAAQQRPVFVHAEERAQLRYALDFAERYGLRIVIVGGADAADFAGELAQRKIPVVIGGVHRVPLRRDDPIDAMFTLPAKLHEAGVQFCIAPAGGRDAMVRHLPFEAGRAVAHGLPEAAALRAITASAAEILGLSDRLGALEVGRHASLIVSDGSPLEPRSRIERVFIQGREIDTRNHQTRLLEKYEQRLHKH